MRTQLILYLLLPMIVFLSLIQGNGRAQEYQIASSERVALIYENNLASIYRLPPKGALEGTSEEVASFILQQVAQKGLTEILAKVTSALVSKLGGLFLTFITESKEVGIPTRTDMVVLTGNELTNTVQSNRDFLPFIVVTAGTSFDYGVALTYERSTELFKWEIVRQVELLGFEELSALYQQGVLQYGDRFLVVPKEPFQLSTTGKYRLLAKAWSDSEGKSSYVLRVVEASRKQIADITLTVTPSVFYIDVEVDVTATVRESNGIGVDLNYVRGAHYDTQGNLIAENEVSGDEARQAFDESFDTHYLPPYGTLQTILPDAFMDRQTPGKTVMTIGGTDDNGNFVTHSWESEIQP